MINRLVTTEEFIRAPIVKKLNETHKQLQAKFKNKVTDEKIAQDLQEFMNYIIYDNNSIKTTNQFAQGINEEIRNQLHERPEIKNLNVRIQDKTGRLKLSGAAGERAVSFLVLEAIKNLEQDENVKNQIEDIINTDVEKLVIGDMQATTSSFGVTSRIIKQAKEEEKKMEKKIVEHATDDLNNKITEQKNKAYYLLNRKYGTFALKSGKVDVAGKILLDGSIDFSPKAKQLLQLLSMSVKNYSDSRIHLETVNKKKSYQGIMATLYPSLHTEEVNKIYEYYYENRTGLEYKESLNEHFLHVVNLYALTGTGQTYFDKINHETIEFHLGAKFIVINQSKESKIYVIPSSKIINSFDNHNEIFSYGYFGNSAAVWSDSSKSIHVNLELSKYNALPN